MALSKEQLKEVETSLIQLAQKEIGPLIKSQSGTKFESFEDKANNVDLVTVVDKKVENIVQEFLTKKYPDFAFVGEEGFIKGETKIGNKPTFIVDPIDGTTNFIHGYPYSCTSLGLSEGGKAVVGVVHNPHLNQTFHASKGNGAFLNDERIQVTPRPLILQKSIIGLESGSERAESPGSNFETKLRTTNNLLSEKGGFIHGSRSHGSTAMDLCYVATGLLDAYWEGGPWAWDVCAGWCIIEETGGIMVGANPGEWEIPLENRRYFAVRGGAKKEEQNWFVESLWSHVEGRLSY